MVFLAFVFTESNILSNSSVRVWLGSTSRDNSWSQGGDWVCWAGRDPWGKGGMDEWGRGGDIGALWYLTACIIGIYHHLTTIWKVVKGRTPVVTGVVVSLGVVTATCLTAALVPCVALAVWQSIVHTESHWCW